MLNRRIHLHGLFAVLLALMAQLVAGGSAPRIDPIAGVAVLCHTVSHTGVPSKAPVHPGDCPICPLCIALHAPAIFLVASLATPLPPVAVSIVRLELPPPSTAPPTVHRLPGQPRAPPIFS